MILISDDQLTNTIAMNNTSEADVAPKAIREGFKNSVRGYPPNPGI